MLGGYFDELTIKAQDAELRELRFQELDIHGKDIKANISSLALGLGAAVNSSQELQFLAVMNERDLEAYLSDKLPDVENFKVEITPDDIITSGDVELLGKKIKVDMHGNVQENAAMLMYHMTKIEVNNSSLGSQIIGNLFGDIMLFDLQNISGTTTLDSVKQEAGQLVIRASSKNTAPNLQPINQSQTK